MSTTETRAPLTRERIIEAALAFVEKQGLDELSMRKLGAELGVEAMSLYNHVANKDDILDGMIDRVFGMIDTPGSDVDWRDWVRESGRSAFAVLTSHPWVVSLLMQRGNLTPAPLRLMDRSIGVFLGAGFTPEDAHHAWQMLASHTMGYTFQSASLMPEVEQGFEEQLHLVGDQYPNVARIAPLLVDCAFDEEYLFGLEIIIDGLAARLSPRA